MEINVAKEIFSIGSMVVDGYVDMIVRINDITTTKVSKLVQHTGDEPVTYKTASASHFGFVKERRELRDRKVL